MMKTLNLIRTLAAVTAAWVLTGDARAQMVNLYVGIDGREILASGTYVGKPNPNYGRLTLLYAHPYPYGEFANNHYHGIGAYTLTGDAASPVVNHTSAGNRIPEVYTELPGVALVRDTNAVWAGKLISRRHVEHYSDFRLRSVHSLSQFGEGSSELAMFRSSAGTRTNLMPGAVIALELVSKSAGLGIASAQGAAILANPGDRQVIGEGDDFNFEFLPVFWVEAAAAPGTYSAEFRLVDVNTEGGRTPMPASGRFSFDFRVPGTPELSIARTVTLTVPLVLDGWSLESATNADGPWSAAEIPAAEESHTQTRPTRDVTLPVTADRQFYRLVPQTAAAN